MRNNLQGTTSSIKPPRHSHSRHFAEKNFARKCSWRCIAIFFVVLAVILSAALAYITGKFFKSFVGVFPLNNSMFCKNRNVTLKVLVKHVTAHKSTHWVLKISFHWSFILDRIGRMSQLHSAATLWYIFINKLQDISLYLQLLMVCQTKFHSYVLFFSNQPLHYLNAAELNAIVHIRSKEGDIVLPLI